MSFSIRFSDAALRSLQRIPKKFQIRLLRAVEGLRVSPFQGKKLQGQLAGMYSLRVWPYRIIYLVRKHELIVLVVDIGHRQSVYHARN